MRSSILYDCCTDADFMPLTWIIMPCICQDFNGDGSKIISSGMDHALKVWLLTTEPIKTAIATSYDRRAGELP